MDVTNKTLGAMYYAGKSYGPGQSFTLADGDEKKGDISGLIGNGSLGVKLSAKPSEGLTVDELKAALTVKKVAIPEKATKAELATLLDGAP
jgi:hypothetical protein